MGARLLGPADAGAPTSAAVAELADGGRVVVRVAGDDDAGRELLAEARVLGSLSAGVRSLLPFRIPRLLGEAGLADGRAVVVDFIDGYRVEAVDIPSGPGFASLLGRAVAAVHDLPVTVIRAEGLPVRDAAQVRDEVRRLVARVDGSGRLPRALHERWRGVVADDAVWRFESTVVLDGLEASSFVFADAETGPEVVGLLGWRGLSIGDPATDLRWLANAPEAAEAVHDAYAEASHRAPDPGLAVRARLFAELEFARWLVHGLDRHDEIVVEDAARLLESLAGATEDEDLVVAPTPGVDDAIALLDRVPETAEPDVDTSMHTDAYDPAALGAYLSDDRRSAAEDDSDSEAIPTLPVDLSEWTGGAARADAVPPADATGELGGSGERGTAGGSGESADDRADAGDPGDREEADRASRAALRRWSES